MGRTGGETLISVEMRRDRTVIGPGAQTAHCAEESLIQIEVSERHKLGLLSLLSRLTTPATLNGNETSVRFSFVIDMVPTFT